MELFLLKIRNHSEYLFHGFYPNRPLLAKKKKEKEKTKYIKTTTLKCSN